MNSSLYSYVYYLILSNIVCFFVYRVISLQWLYFQMQKEQDNPNFSIITSSSSFQDVTRPLNKFQIIQEKLERFSKTREINKEIENNQKINFRLCNIESRLIEEELLMQENLCSWRDILSQMRIQAQLNEKRRTALAKQRRQKIKQLKLGIKMATQIQKYQQKQSQDQILEKFSVTFHKIGNSLQKECAEQVEQINKAQSKFEVELPNLHQRITTNNSYIHAHFISKQKEAIQFIQSFKKTIHLQQKQQEKSNRQIMELICCTIEQIQSDLQNERHQRRRMQEKLQFLINKASNHIHSLSPIFD